MNCPHFKPISEPDERGYVRWQCDQVACILHHKIANTLHPAERIHGPCLLSHSHVAVYRGFRLGDRVAWMLDLVGLTKERWAKITGETGCCACDKRREVLNRLSDPRWFLHKVKPAAVWILRRLP